MSGIKYRVRVPRRRLGESAFSLHFRRLLSGSRAREGRTIVPRGHGGSDDRYVTACELAASRIDLCNPFLSLSNRVSSPTGRILFSLFMQLRFLYHSRNCRVMQSLPFTSTLVTVARARKGHVNSRSAEMSRKVFCRASDEWSGEH